MYIGLTRWVDEFGARDMRVILGSDLITALKRIRLDVATARIGAHAS